MNREREITQQIRGIIEVQQNIIMRLSISNSNRASNNQNMVGGKIKNNALKELDFLESAILGPPYDMPAYSKIEEALKYMRKYIKNV